MIHTQEQANNMTVLPPDPERATQEGKNKFLGTWLFIGGESVLFATLFGTFIGYRNSTANGPTSQDLFHLDLIALSTVILLVSSLTSVLAIINMKANQPKKMFFWFAITALLGYSFLALELYEFSQYIAAGLTISTSAFGSAFFLLVGTHGAHVAFGATWIVCLILKYRKIGINVYNAPKFYVASLYWHFVDVVWVFVFTVVYLMGVL